MVARFCVSRWDRLKIFKMFTAILNKGFLSAATPALAETFKIGYLSGNRLHDGQPDISLPGLRIRSATTF